MSGSRGTSQEDEESGMKARAGMSFFFCSLIFFRLGWLQGGKGLS